MKKIIIILISLLITGLAIGISNYLYQNAVEQDKIELAQIANYMEEKMSTVNIENQERKLRYRHCKCDS